MLEMTEAEIVELFNTNGFIGCYISGDWWRYTADHVPGKARMIAKDVPEKMLAEGKIEQTGVDVFCKMRLYGPGNGGEG